MKELKPCPFCGGEAIIYQNYNEYGIWTVSCDVCHVEMVSGVRDILVAAWNVRPIEDVAPKKRKEITEILNDLSAAHGRANRRIAMLEEKNQRMKETLAEIGIDMLCFDDKNADKNADKIFKLCKDRVGEEVLQNAYKERLKQEVQSE